MEKQRTRYRVGLVSLILSLTVAVTGCSTPNFVESHYDGGPPGVTVTVDDVPSAYANSTTLFLTLGGSSSCPPEPTSLTNVNGVAEITVVSDTEGPCTMDFQVTTHEIAISTAIKEVKLVFNNGDRKTIAVKLLE